MFRALLDQVPGRAETEANCGMTTVSRDPHKQNLLWCEFAPEPAERYIAGE
jgi:hypothetical protein